MEKQAVKNMSLSEFRNLTIHQQIVFDELYRQAKLPAPTFPVFGKFPKTKGGREFFKPFLDFGIIHKDTLKFTGVARMTPAGFEMYESIQKEKQKY